MSDPPRLLATHRGLTAEMLDSARDDGPPSSSRQRALVAFGVGAGSILTAGLAEGGAGLAAGSAAGASVASAAKAATWVVIAKWAGGGALVAVCAAAAVTQVTPRASVARLDAPPIAAPATTPATIPEKVAAPVALPAPIDPLPDPLPAAVPTPAVPLAATGPREATPPMRVAMARAASEETHQETHSETAALPPPLPLDDKLVREVQWLDRARHAIDVSGDVEEGLRNLDEYKKRFPSGTLTPESEVLRINALVKKGDRAQATRLGEAFLARSPLSPHANSVRSLLASVRKEPSP